MILTIQDLMNMKASLQKLMSYDLPIKTAWSLAKLIKLLDSEYKILEECKIKLFKKYGEEQIDKSLKIKSENIEKFNKEMEVLMSTEVNIDQDKICLPESENTNISVLDLLALEKILILNEK